MISSSSHQYKYKCSPSPERPLTPRRQYTQHLIRYYQKKQNVASQDIIKLGDILNRARNSHNNLCKYLNITPEIGASFAFPRNHTWTRYKKLCPSDIDAQNLSQRILQSSPEEKELWQKRQDYIGQQSLEFLLKSQIMPKSEIMPKNAQVIADLLCETGGFLKALENAKQIGKIKYDTAYGIDLDEDIIKLAKEWGIKSPLHQKNLTNTREENTPQADFIYMSAPITWFEKEQNAYPILKGIHQYAKKNSKIFFPLSCAPDNHISDANNPQRKILEAAVRIYFNFDTIITAQTAEEKGWCKKDHLIADSYAEIWILSPKDTPSEIPSPFLNEQAILNKNQADIAGKMSNFLYKTKIFPPFSPDKAIHILDLFSQTNDNLKAFDIKHKYVKFHCGAMHHIPTIEDWQNIAHQVFDDQDKNILTNLQTQKADFIYLSTPLNGFGDEEQTDKLFQKISQHIEKKGGKIFFPCVSHQGVPFSIINKYFDYDLITAKDAEEKGWCEKDRLIADTYGGCFILTPKKTEASSSHFQ